MLSKISTSSAPAAIGPYSQAIIAGNLVFVAGQLPFDPATGELGERDISVQTRLSIENIRSILSEASLDLNSVIKTTVYLKDMEDFDAMNKVYSEYFTDVCPARVAVEVSALPKGAIVEIDAIASV